VASAMAGGSLVGISSSSFDGMAAGMLAGIAGGTAGSIVGVLLLKSSQRSVVAPLAKPA
jgi:hypothetical protein